MSIPKLNRPPCIFFFAVAALSGCSQSISRPVPMPPGGATASVLIPFAAPFLSEGNRAAAPPPKSSPGLSWMSPEAATEDLLYVANLHNVAVYSYPQGKRVGMLRGFYPQASECVDAAGDVFIGDGDTIAEYKHGGKKAINTLTFAGYSALDCASDRSTGNLAVMWDESYSGYVAIYHDASGTPTLYSLSEMVPTGCGYDDKGNLFVDGHTSHGFLFTFAELSKGATALNSVSLNQSIVYGGAVQWDGKYVTVQDIDPSVNKIYRFAISGSSGTLKGTVDLMEAPSQYEPGPTWIIGKTVIEANIALVNNQPLGIVAYYRYPKGGSATKTIADGDDTAPGDVIVSLAPH